jgi:hypothetical protein
MRSLARAEDAAGVLRRLRALRADSPRRWGRMSAHQMVCHLSDAFLCATGDKPARDASNPFTRTLVKWWALGVPLRWPAGVPTRPEMDQEKGGTRPGEFAADVERLAVLVERLTAPSLDFAWGTHPLFGRMAPASWLRWGWLHMDHHLRQFGV